MPRLVRVGTLACVNGDTFRTTREVTLRPESDLWHLGSVAVTSMRRAVERLDGHLTTSVMAEAVGGTFKRDSLEAARQFLEENDLVPMQVYHEDELQKSIPNPDRVAHVLTVIGFKDGYYAVRIQIVVSGPNQVIVNGLVAEAERVLSKIEKEDQPGAAPAMTPARKAALEKRLAQASSASSGEPAAPSPAERQTLVEPTAEARSQMTERESFWAWLKSTRREHAVVFMITVIGGVLVLGFTAWLGLN